VLIITILFFNKTVLYLHIQHNKCDLNKVYDIYDLLLRALFKLLNNLYAIQLNASTAYDVLKNMHRYPTTLTQVWICSQTKLVSVIFNAKQILLALAVLIVILR
jgi:hypothetical protein